MIRFIDLGKQLAVDETDPDWPRQFAFFDTIYSQFLKIADEVVFDSYVDFAECIALDPSYLKADVNRLISLMPDWAKTIQVKQPRSSFKIEGLPNVR